VVAWLSCFSYPYSLTVPGSGVIVVMYVQTNAEARRNQLMRDMAQLRLQDEVTRLEGSLTGTSAEDMASSRPGTATILPPYVVPDGPSLCDHLSVIKQLAASSRFIIIIPIDGESALLLISVIVLVLVLVIIKDTV